MSDGGVRRIQEWNSMLFQENPNYITKIYRRNMGQYYSYIICCYFENGMKLDLLWESIVEQVAFDLQAELDNEIERGNIYIVFCVKNEIEYSQRRKIEGDRYSARKIVIDNCESLENFDEILEYKLFNLKDCESFSNNNFAFIQWLEDKDDIVADIYKKIPDGKAKVVYKEIINEMVQEEKND